MRDQIFMTSTQKGDEEILKFVVFLDSVVFKQHIYCSIFANGGGGGGMGRVQKINHSFCGRHNGMIPNVRKLIFQFWSQCYSETAILVSQYIYVQNKIFLIFKNGTKTCNCTSLFKQMLHYQQRLQFHHTQSLNHQQNLLNIQHFLNYQQKDSKYKIFPTRFFFVFFSIFRYGQLSLFDF